MTGLKTIFAATLLLFNVQNACAIRETINEILVFKADEVTQLNAQKVAGKTVVLDFKATSDVLAKLPKEVTKLSLSDTHVTDLSHFGQLQELSFSGGSCPDTVLEKLPQLTYFKAFMTTGLTDKGLQSLKNLESLYLFEMSEITAAAFQHLLHLKNVMISDCPKITANDLDALKKRGVTIQE